MQISAAEIMTKVLGRRQTDFFFQGNPYALLSGLQQERNSLDLAKLSPECKAVLSAFFSLRVGGRYILSEMSCQLNRYFPAFCIQKRDFYFIFCCSPAIYRKPSLCQGNIFQIIVRLLLLFLNFRDRKRTRKSPFRVLLIFDGINMKFFQRMPVFGKMQDNPDLLADICISRDIFLADIHTGFFDDLIVRKDLSVKIQHQSIAIGIIVLKPSSYNQFLRIL